jgi:hypothetical protein
MYSFYIKGRDRIRVCRGGDTDVGQIGALVDAQLTAVLDGEETGSCEQDNIT